MRFKCGPRQRVQRPLKGSSGIFTFLKSFPFSVYVHIYKVSKFRFRLNVCAYVQRQGIEFLFKIVIYL